MLKTMFALLSAASILMAEAPDQGRWIGPNPVKDDGSELLNSGTNVGNHFSPILSYGWCSYYNGAYAQVSLLGEKLMRFYPADYGWTYPIEIDSLRADLVSGYTTTNPVRFLIYKDNGSDSLWWSSFLTNPPCTLKVAVTPPVVVTSDPSFFAAVHNNTYNKGATVPSQADSGYYPPIQGTATGTGLGHSYSRYPPTWPSWTVASREYALYAYVRQYSASNNSDLAMVSIDAPGTWGINPDTIFTKTVYNPQATVKNNGPATATFSVQCIITAPGQPTYTSSKGVTNLASGSSIQVTFDPWTTASTAAITYTDSVKAILSTDPNQANNILVKQYYAKGDVGFFDPVEPLDTVYVNTTYNPSARVKRYTPGATGAFVDSCVIIDEGGGIVYIGTQTDSLAPTSDSVHTVIFPDWLVPSTVGVTYEIDASTRMPGDFNPTNDKLVWNVVSMPSPNYDVGVASIDAPTRIVPVGHAITPKATVRNFGNQPVTFEVVCIIGPDTSWKTVTDLTKNTTQQLAFHDWTSNVTGDFTMLVKTLLSTDANHLNDMMSLTFSVRGIEESAFGVPTAFKLEAVRPNPVSTWAVINYALPVHTTVSLAVYDVTGKVVKMLATGPADAGNRTVRWDGRDNANRPVPNGLYFIRMETPYYSATTKIVLAR